MPELGEADERGELRDRLDPGPQQPVLEVLPLEGVAVQPVELATDQVGRPDLVELAHELREDRSSGEAEAGSPVSADVNAAPSS